MEVESDISVVRKRLVLRTPISIRKAGEGAGTMVSEVEETLENVVMGGREADSMGRCRLKIFYDVASCLEVAW